MLGGVGVAGSDVFVLEGLELLLGAEFVGLGRVSGERSSSGELLTMVRECRWCCLRYRANDWCCRWTAGVSIL